MTKYEHRRQAPLSRRQFVRRLLRQGAYGGAMMAGSLALGMAGYHWIAGFAWIDALLNASMLLGGMGPVGDLTTSGAKLFASAYALYSGVIFLVLTGLLLSPVFHRVLHKFHWEAERDAGRNH